MGVSPLKRYFYYFATLLLVLLTTNNYMGGGLFRLAGKGEPYGAAEQLMEKEYSSKGTQIEETPKEPDLEELIGAKSCEFVRLAFSGRHQELQDMLLGGTEYITAADGSSFIRYATPELHVEGYMATNKRLVAVVPKWTVKEDDGTIISGVEVHIEGEEAPQSWYLHYCKSMGQWKIYMLENGV